MLVASRRAHLRSSANPSKRRLPDGRRFRGIERLERRLLMAANNWKGAVSGDWSDAAKWSAGHVPTASEDVSINVAGSYTVTHTSGAVNQAKSLTINAAVELNAGKIEVTGAVAVNGGTLTFKSGTLAKGTLSTSGSGHIAVASTGALDGVTIASDLPVAAGSTLYLYHTVTLNSGKKITASDATVYLYDQPDGGATLAGSGEVVLNGATGGNFYLYNGYGHAPSFSATTKVHGYGQVYFYGGTNNGTIQADQNAKTLTISGATWVNKGTLSAINGGILSVGGTWSSPSPGKLNENASTLNLAGTASNIPLPTRTGGTISITGIFDLTGGTLALTATSGSWNISGTIKNGTISTAGGAQLASVGAPTFDNVTLASDITVTSATVYLTHTVTLGAGKKIIGNNSTIYLYDQPTGGASLAGSGEVVLGGTTGSNFYLYNGYGHNPTVNAAVKVHGFGQVYFYGGTNNGTIQADQTGKTLTITGATWVNKGTLSAINGGTLSVGGTWSSPSPGKLNENASTLNLGGTFNTIPLPTRTGGAINVTGIYDLKNTTLALTAASGAWNLSGGTILNATLSFAGGVQLNVVGTGTFDHVTLGSDLTVTGATLYLEHANTLAAGKKLIGSNATIYLYDQPSGAASLAGSGEVVLGGTSGSNFYFYNGYGHNPSVGASVLVHGFGQVYFYGGTNNGTIRADQSGKTLTITGATWVNKGTLSAINGGILSVGGTWSSPSPGKLSENASTLNLGGTFNTIPLPTRTGGTVNVTGVYDLGGAALTLNTTTGSWNLAGGRILNGKLSFAGAVQLNVVSSGYLDKVTLASDLTVTAATLYLYHGCSLAAGVKLIGSNATIYLYDQPDAAASLGGTGEVVLGGSSGSNFYYYNGYGHLPNTGSGIRVHGFGQVYFYGGINNGVIEADTTGKTLTIAGSPTNKGLMKASHGATLLLSSPATFTNQGILAAEGGIVQINGAFNCGAAGTLAIGIGGSGQGTTYGLINVVGALTLGGSFTVYRFNGFSPANNATFTPIKYTSKSGSFAINNLNVGNNIAFTPTIGATALSIKASTGASSVASISGGKLTLNGTGAADTLVVTDAFGIVTASRGGVGSVFSSASITAGISISGGDGNDTITYTGSLIASTLHGGNGNDVITGSNAADEIWGDAGNDTATGNGGNDRYQFAAATAAETDLIGEAGGGGLDTLDFAALTTAVTVKLNNDTLATMTNRTLKTKTAGQFANIENAVGGAGNDSITGNAAANNVQGGAGNDTFFMQDGTGNTDSVDGGAGNGDVLQTKDNSDISTNVP